jgi:dTDP-4-dehydrorhamnose 3,5-epimerase-like enzyme
MIKTKFKDLFIVQNKSFKDNRGYFKELIREKKSIKISFFSYVFIEEKCS